MKVQWKRALLAFTAAATLVLVVGQTATATGPPGVEPAIVAATMLPGTSMDVAKTVHTSTIPPNPDLVFLADTTGSMAGAIGNVQTNAINVMNTVLGAQPSSNFGAASYKDFNCDPIPYSLDAPLSPSTALTQLGINTWSASGGCDLPEADLFGLEATANGILWRPGSSRIIAWFGDAPGHDPTGPTNGTTLATTIAALQAKNIRVIAVNVGNLDGFGQATAITSATGGVLLNSGGDVSGAILAGLSNLPADVGWNASCDPGLNVSLSPTHQVVASGDDAHFTETVSVDPSALAGTYVCHVRFTINGVDAGDAFAETVTITVPPPDLSIVKTGPATVIAGSNITYNLVATNNGPTTATGVTVSDPVPANSTFVSASPGCVLSAGVVTCSAGTLASGASQSFTVTVTPGSGGSVVNTATISGDQPDPNGGNNTSTVTTSVNHNADLSAVKTGPAFVADGGSITYTVTVTNNGPAPATNVVVSDTIPPSITGASATPSQGSCSGSFICSLGNLASGASATVTITGTVSSTSGSTVSNTACASADNPDPAPANNCSTTTATVFTMGAGGGAFVVGDLSAVGPVTFWGAQWWKLNSLSGGTAPAAFKGFASAPARPACGVGWTTGPGNSPPPPAGPLPPLMGVIVSSSISQSGSTISGNTVHIVIVQTNPGYDANPGHAGTGTVIATYC